MSNKEHKCETCQDCGSRRELAVDKFSQLLKDDPNTAKNVKRLGELVSIMRDIILKDENLTEKLFEGQTLDLMAYCPNSTEMLVVTINMISQLPAHELEMIHEL
jgi:hypothetical protein